MTSEYKPERGEEAGPLTKEEIQREIKARVSRIDREFAAAFEFIMNYPKSVSFFGSARFDQKNVHCVKARSLAARISQELGYSILTGGSEGIMEAANCGAGDANGQSIGLNIRLPDEQKRNQCTTASMDFSYFFVRKVALSFAAEAYLFFPGGFGTLDEFFDIITLIQTNKIRRVPIFLVGEDYWRPLDRFLRENVFAIHQAVDKRDLGLYKIIDNEDDIIEAIHSVPIHDGMARRKLRSRGAA